MDTSTEGEAELWQRPSHFAQNSENSSSSSAGNRPSICPIRSVGSFPPRVHRPEGPDIMFGCSLMRLVRRRTQPNPSLGSEPLLRDVAVGCAVRGLQELLLPVHVRAKDIAAGNQVQRAVEEFRGHFDERGEGQRDMAQPPEELLPCEVRARDLRAEAVRRDRQVRGERAVRGRGRGLRDVLHSGLGGVGLVRQWGGAHELRGEGPDRQGRWAVKTMSRGSQSEWGDHSSLFRRGSAGRNQAMGDHRHRGDVWVDRENAITNYQSTTAGFEFKTGNLRRA